MCVVEDPNLEAQSKGDHALAFLIPHPLPKTQVMYTAGA